MLRNYLKIAGKVLLRRKFYTAVSLFGIAFTLLVLILCSALADEMFASAYPETRRNRTLGIFRAEISGGGSLISSDAGYALLDRYARDLPYVERFSAISTPSTVTSFVDGEKIESKLRRTDGQFWEIMDFDFLEGGPFTAEDENLGNFVAVINETTRERIFRGESAVGKTLRAGGQSFTVVGVVRDVPLTRLFSFSEIWAPLSTAKSSDYRDQLVGGFTGILLAESSSRFPEIKAEFKRRLAETELTDAPGFDTVKSSARTLLEQYAYLDTGEEMPEGAFVALRIAQAGLLVLLFMTLPALNLINLNLSRILERTSEIGVRKAFGASSRTLVGQFLVESVALTVIGGVLGLIGAEVAMAILNASDVIPYASVHVNYRVFAYGLLLSIVFGVISGAYPAWRMSRMHPAEAIRGRV